MPPFRQKRKPLTKISEPLLKKLHTILHKLELSDYKQDLIDTFAIKGRYIFTSKNLYEQEAEAIIKYLKSIQRENDMTREQIIADILCRKIFACFGVMGWKTPERKLDLGKVYGWINSNGYLNKHLKKYTIEELPKLAEQVVNLRDEYLLEKEKKLGN